MMVKREPTSINVNPDLWKDAKIEAIKRGITVTELFETALAKEIGKPVPSGKIEGAKIKGGKL
ncbi:hypothetical protein Ngar_c05020 [Candidatus Nitrososphaera gargensis Ga9.2]|uniref:Uncharacterized protein n=1 Tax=Nitrososphaera gargensis (strain Ga9.2) TaxID=1237085 RepID=K0I850_NITGG|nr:hypothetical protein [Candidatus Nitrososphaera gargensis]AFU57446.1 hypothetical protein Ngar_c05020 [Candidatus Nitrososphaera gargensis Ga9.2]